MNLPEPIAQLVEALHKLPGIGPRSAERLALHLVQSETGGGEAPGAIAGAGAGTHPELLDLRLLDGT